MPEPLAAAACRKIPGAKATPLRQRLCFVPITEDALGQLSFLFADEPDRDGQDKFERLTGGVWRVAADLSENGSVAYIETEYFGGLGDQAAIAWREGRVVLSANRADIGPINAALRVLGAAAQGQLDEFESVGLGRYRSNESWLEAESEAG